MHARFVENDRRTRMGEKKKFVRVDVAARGKRTSLELLGKFGLHDARVRTIGVVPHQIIIIIVRTIDMYE